MTLYMVALSSRPPVRERDICYHLNFRRRVRARRYGRDLCRLMLEHNSLNWTISIYRLETGGEFPADLSAPVWRWAHLVDFNQATMAAS